MCYKNDTVSELKNRVAAESKRGGVENLRFFINAKELTAALDTQTLSEIRVEDGSVVVFANRPSGMPAQGDAAALPVLKSDAKDRVPALIISNQYFTQLFDMLALDEQLSYSVRIIIGDAYFCVGIFFWCRFPFLLVFSDTFPFRFGTF